jgi:hypothetical protein
VGTAAVLILLILVAAFALARPLPAFTTQVLEVAKLGDKHFSVTLLVSNRTQSAYALMPGFLQSWDGVSWNFCPELTAAYSQNDTLGAHRARSVFCAYENSLHGARLRLVIKAEKVRHGLELYLFNLKCSLFGEDRGLRPGQHTMNSDVIVTSAEFREP